ncbi:DUF3885 domain-containing protein [Actinoallomurus bryophytorum]|uniref:DUF3885 domain-containing protein n=1 Tax=Actinoallomurus bryophytorum TaxID=1490222 RepID=UPI001C88E2C6|nr:hypothetical protein [Actinoallomurus bryophytorum]
MTEDETRSLTARWRTSWGGDPIAHELRDRHADRWVRFHSLPKSKRYAETEEEYEVVLDRHHRVLSELGPGDLNYVIAGYFEDARVGGSHDPRTHPGAVPWLRIEPGDRTFFDIPLTLYVSETSLDRTTLDPLLRRVADDELGYVIIAPLDLRWLYHPYDGGADVIAPTAGDRDILKNRHANWMSAHPAGL